MARYSLFVLKVLLNTNQPTFVVYILQLPADSYDYFACCCKK